MTKQNKCSLGNPNAAINYIAEAVDPEGRKSIVMGTKYYRHILGKTSKNGGCERCYREFKTSIERLRSTNSAGYEKFKKFYTIIESRSRLKL